MTLCYITIYDKLRSAVRVATAVFVVVQWVEHKVIVLNFDDARLELGGLWRAGHEDILQLPTRTGAGGPEEIATPRNITFVTDTTSPCRSGDKSGRDPCLARQRRRVRVCVSALNPRSRLWVSAFWNRALAHNSMGYNDPLAI